MKMKKLLTLSLSTVIAVSMLAGCSSNDSKTEKTANVAATSSQTQTDETETTEETESGETEAGETTASSEGVITLKVWGPQEDQIAYDGYENGLLVALCEQFAALNPEYDISFEYGVVSEADVHKEVLKDTDEAADVFLMSNDNIAALADAGAIARLGGTTADEITANVSESMLGSVTYNGGIYGIPYTTNTYFMYYDTSLYTEEEVLSLETMMAKDLGDGIINFSFDLDNSWYAPGFFYAAGGELFGSDGSDNDAKTTFGEHPEATQYLINLYADSKFLMEDDNKIALARFEEGTLGAYVSGSWDAATIKEYLGDNFGVTKLPAIHINGEDNQLMSFAGSKAVIVNAASDKLAVAVKLAAYLGGEEAQTVRYETRGFTPTWASVESLEAVQSDPVVNAEILQIKEASMTQPLVSNLSKFWTPMESLVSGIATGEVTLDNCVEKTKLMGDTISE